MGPCTTFHIGDKVVYPNHGVGTIENISTRNFGAQSERFYLLLNRLAAEGAVEVEQVLAVDDDVQSVYRYLISGQAQGAS